MTAANRPGVTRRLLDRIMPGRTTDRPEARAAWIARTSATRRGIIACPEATKRRWLCPAPAPVAGRRLTTGRHICGNPLPCTTHEVATVGAGSLVYGHSFLEVPAGRTVRRDDTARQV